MVSNEEQKVRLRSSDGKIFEVDKAVAMKSGTIASWLVGQNTPGEFISVLHVTSSVLVKVIQYCTHHACQKEEDCDFSSSGGVRRFDPFDDEFMKVDQDTLFHLIQAADYLDIKGLQDLGCRTVANMMNGRSVEEIRKIFNIKNDYSPEEEAALKKEKAWAFGDL